MNNTTTNTKGNEMKVNLSYERGFWYASTTISNEVWATKSDSRTEAIRQLCGLLHVTADDMTITD